VVGYDAPPPLPPKPGSKPLPRPPAVGAQFSHQGPPRGNPLNTRSSGGVPPQHQQPPFSSQHRFGPPPQSTHGAAASVVGSDEPQYVHMMSREEQELVRQRARASDTESKLRERELELSQCHTEIVKIRRCVNDKKEEVKAKEQEIARLQAELDRLRQGAIGRAQPMVAGNEAALQAEVQQYRRVVQDLRAEMEQLRGQQNVAPPPAATDMQELIRLRGEVQWHHGERQRMLQEIGVLKSSEQVITAQVKTYQEDFESERQDRERAHATIDKMREEIANLNHIITMLGGQEQQ
jgi:chromosome segregation ATPase